MGVIYDVVGEFANDDQLRSFGARRTRDEAEALLSEQRRVYAGTRWEFRIETVDTAGLFDIPERPTPRERFTVRITPAEFPLTSGRRYRSRYSMAIT